jgi:DinB family protein
MNTTDLTASLTALMRELVDGTAPTGGYMLNRGDKGLFASLEKISASEASTIISGGSSIAAHVDHCMFYFALNNRWAAGEKNPWKGTDWKVSWTRTSVTPESWARLRSAFESETRRWLDAVARPREVTEVELTSMIASIVHLAYHVGAIRQMNRATGGPSANNEQDALTSTTP